jgi:hypothetical protein
MLGIKKESAWQFITSSSGGIGVEFVAAEGGAIYLSDPRKTRQAFRYGAAGAGISCGLKLPKIGKIDLPKIQGKSVGGVAAPAAFTNAGKIYILDSFSDNELSRSDITGVCMFVKVGGGLIGGGSATAMVLGMDAVWLAGTLATIDVSQDLAMYAAQRLLESATAILVMAGFNVGLQAGAGAAGFLGALF